MNSSERQTIKVAILDLYQGVANQGMRCIREILSQFSKTNDIEFVVDEFDVRQKNEVPDMSFDIFISSGGPGSPLESEGSEWEKVYFQWLHQVERWNNSEAHVQKKYVFFICHSFQLACRYYHIGTVCNRRSTSFGVFPVHLLHDGKNELVFDGMKDPFYAVDSRDYQVVQPNHHKLMQMGATVLAIEKDRPHVNLERAIMAVRFNDFMVGTQFHPEADATGMSLHLQTEDKKKTVIENHGEAKWASMIEQLNDPDKIMHTYQHIMPNFLRMAADDLQLVEV